MIDILHIARDVLDNEITGLKALQSSIGKSFIEAVSTLADTKGRTIVTGMGKSGHVARKIASTLSSTGTPALYVHPGEASHGDLGMITRNDTILALSKSGETSELQDLLAYASRFSIKLVAITGGKKSTLSETATTTIVLPSVSEACDITHAPTTSTTMMMALGDALAISLLRSKGVTATDFHGFHPGGNLGAALRRVSTLMHSATPERLLPLCDDQTPMKQAINTLTKGGFGCIGITDTKGILVGILTDGDVRRHFDEEISSKPISEVMTKAPKTVEPTTIAGDALAIMSAGKITSLFVVENGKPVGLLHIHDCIASGVV